MDDGNIKHDFEQSSKSALHVLKKSLLLFMKGIKHIGTGVTKAAHRNFNHSMKAIKNDGPTKEVIQTPSMTHAEMKIFVERSKEAGVIIGVKEMTPENEFNKRKSNFAQKRIIKHETKIKRLQYLKSLFKSIKPLSRYFQKKIDQQHDAIKQDNDLHSEKRYTIFCNKSHLSFMNDVLEDIKNMRTQKMKEGTMEDINKDGIVDEKDIGDLKSRDVNLSPEEMTQSNEDYGDTMFSEFHHDFCTQKVTKEEYCAMREAMYDLHCHAAKTTADGNVMIAITNEDLSEYMKYAPKSPIREYGSKGGIDIQSIQDNDNLQHLKVTSEQEWQAVKNKYTGADYIASHNPDGSISFLVREKDTEVIMAHAQKKTTTDTLLEEAKQMSMEKDTTLNMDAVDQTMDTITNDIEDSIEGVDL